MPSVASVIAPPFVTRMRARYPKVTFRISEGLTNVIVDGLIAKNIDLGLISGRADAQSALRHAASDRTDVPNRTWKIQGGETDGRSDVTKSGELPAVVPGRGHVLREQIKSLSRRTASRSISAKTSIARPSLSTSSSRA